METSKITVHSAHDHSLHTETLIDAPQRLVWRVLTDFAAMADWSPNFKTLRGDFRHGGQVTTVFDLGNGLEEYVATLILSEGHEFGWSEDYDGIRDHHIHRAEAVGEHQTRFIQTDTFRGEADWTTTAALAEFYLPIYTAFNRALKAKCERIRNRS